MYSSSLRRLQPCTSNGFANMPTSMSFAPFAAFTPEKVTISSVCEYMSATYGFAL